MHCRKCDADTERYASGGCKPCKAKHHASNREARSKQRREHYAENREAVLERSRAWAAEHPEYMREKGRRFHAANPEYAREASRRWRDEHPEQAAYMREYGARYYEANRDGVRARHRLNYEANRAGANLRVVRRRVRQREAVPVGRVDEVRAYEAGLRRAQVEYRARGIDTHVDHIVPLARGGEHVPENLRLIRAADNLRKKDKLDAELDFVIEPLTVETLIREG
jgi:5-methylcytosine-specific restriction endonuclease McrA